MAIASNEFLWMYILTLATHHLELCGDNIIVVCFDVQTEWHVEDLSTIDSDIQSQKSGPGIH